MSQIGNKVEDLIMGIILAVVLLAVGVALGPTVIATAGDINATALSGIPLADVIVLLAEYVGTFYYLGIVLGMMLLIWATVRFKK